MTVKSFQSNNIERITSGWNLGNIQKAQESIVSLNNYSKDIPGNTLIIGFTLPVVCNTYKHSPIFQLQNMKCNFDYHSSTQYNHSKWMLSLNGWGSCHTRTKDSEVWNLGLKYSDVIYMGHELSETSTRTVPRTYFLLANVYCCLYNLILIDFASYFCIHYGWYIWFQFVEPPVFWHRYAAQYTNCVVKTVCVHS